MKKRICLLSSAAFALAAVGTSHPVYAEMSSSQNNQKVVRDNYGKKVFNTYGNCVRTQWKTEHLHDPCAIYTAAVEPAPSPARMLNKTDRTITFDFDSAELSAQAKAKLDRMAQSLKRSDDVLNAHIVGFADRIGTNDYNERLSARRAAAVKNYLTKRGYLNTRVAETRALGETRSITQCQDKQSRAALIDCLRPDRRVEVEVKFTTSKHSSTHTTQPSANRM